MFRTMLLLLLLLMPTVRLAAQEVPSIDNSDDESLDVIDNAVDPGKNVKRKASNKAANSKHTSEKKTETGDTINSKSKKTEEAESPESEPKNNGTIKKSQPPKPKSDKDLTAKELLKKYTGSDILIPDDRVIDSTLGLNKPHRKGPKTRKSLDISRSWRNRTVPSAGTDGRVIYVYGSTMPVLICSPLKLCDIELEPGEVVKDVNTADPVRWIIVPAIEGSGDMEITHINIKPIEADIETSLIITTDRRSYHIELRSSERDYVPRLAFSYPKNVGKAWSNYFSTKQKQKSERDEESRKASKKRTNPMDFDDGYEISGDNVAWKPRDGDVFNDGRKTYIRMPKNSLHGELPVLHVIGADDEKEVVNYRFRRGVFEVDHVFDSAQLTIGVGSNEKKVVITRGS